MFNKIWEFINGSKTEIVALLAAIAGVLIAVGVAIPVWIWPILGALGFGAVRDAIKKLEQ